MSFKPWRALPFFTSNGRDLTEVMKRANPNTPPDIAAFWDLLLRLAISLWGREESLGSDEAEEAGAEGEEGGSTVWDASWVYVKDETDGLVVADTGLVAEGVIELVIYSADGPKGVGGVE